MKRIAILLTVLIVHQQIFSQGNVGIGTHSSQTGRSKLSGILGSWIIKQIQAIYQFLKTFSMQVEERFTIQMG